MSNLQNTAKTRADLNKVLERYGKEMFDLGYKVGKSGIVHCEDCKFAHLIEPGDDWWECEHDKRVMHSDGFCSWAERKEA